MGDFSVEKNDDLFNIQCGYICLSIWEKSKDDSLFIPVFKKLLDQGLKSQNFINKQLKHSKKIHEININILKYLINIRNSNYKERYRYIYFIFLIARKWDIYQISNRVKDE